MYKDPTEFRKRFAAWKSGEKVYTGGLPSYEDGYESFLATLPDNQKKPGAYNTRRYWELNGKPKNFAEAIGQGMYTFENDNAWHANSVTYNDKNDTYEFMKPNYHETRWMEQVYGYDKDPEFQKEWKVKYNGPMLSDRYVRREKLGLKIKGGQLPKFADGKEFNYFRPNGNQIKIDENTGELVDLVNGERGTLQLPGVTVTATHPNSYRSSYNPNVIGDILLDKARQFIYNRVDPYSYDIGTAIKQLFYKGRNTPKNDVYDALWARYLNRTNKQVGYDIDSYLQPAVYNLTKGKPVGKLYKLTSKAWKGDDNMNPLGDRQLYEMLKSGKKSDFGDGVGGTMTGLGTYTRSLGEDEKGKYMSYYDEWDISPIGNKSGKNGKDQTMGIGTPFSVYDRRYYTDEEAQHILSEYDKMFQSITNAAKNQSITHEIYSPKPYKIKK